MKIGKVKGHLIEMVNKCEICLKNFSDISNLRKHIKKFHPGEVQVIGKYKTEQDYAYTCQYCAKHFSYKHHFNAHLKNHVPDQNDLTIVDNLDNGSKVIISFIIKYFKFIL